MRQQRTVIVVAAGLSLAVIATAVNRLLAHSDGGWFAYAPNTGVAFSPSSTSDVWREAGVWLAAIAIWAGLSLWLFRRRPADQQV